LADAGVFCALALNIYADAGGSLARPCHLAELREAQLVVKFVDNYGPPTDKLDHQSYARSLGQVAIVPAVEVVYAEFAVAASTGHEEIPIARVAAVIDRPDEWADGNRTSGTGVSQDMVGKCLDGFAKAAPVVRRLLSPGHLLALPVLMVAHATLPFSVVSHGAGSSSVMCHLTHSVQ